MFIKVNKTYRVALSSDPHTLMSGEPKKQTILRGPAVSLAVGSSSLFPSHPSLCIETLSTTLPSILSNAN